MPNPSMFNDEMADGRRMKDVIDKMFAGAQEKTEIDAVLAEAEKNANTRAAAILAANECPADLISWGKAHGIPTFAEFTWQAGFLAGMRAMSVAEMS